MNAIARAALLGLLVVAGCGGPGSVQYDNGRCLIDGHDAPLADVEARQATVSQRISARQPLFVVITILVVVLAGASHVEKVVTLLLARRRPDTPWAERLRRTLERYRARPWRYFTIVFGTLGLLVLAATSYIYLDADKRASERALGMLQFCQLELRSADERGMLDEQRRNLVAIQSTAGDIRALVDKLPPEEQRKAQQIVSEMNSALSRQGKLVGEYLQHSDESTRALKEHTALVQKGLSTLESDLGGLKGLPASLRELGESVRRVDGKLAGQEARFGALDAALRDLDGKVKALSAQLAARPASPPPPTTTTPPTSAAAPAVAAAPATTTAPAK